MGRLLGVLVALLVLGGAPLLAQEAITRKYCQKPDQAFQDRCEGLDLTTQAAQCEAAIALAKSECERLAKDWLGSFFEEVLSHAGEIAATAAGLAVTGGLLLLARINTFLRSQIKGLTARFADPYLELAPTYQAFAMNAVVVGTGGTGKTSIVRALSASEEVRPDVKTALNCTYSLAMEVNIQGTDGTSFRRLTRIYLGDHVGQDFSTILKTDFYAAERLAKIKKCLILVVDLFPPANPGEPLKSRPEVDAARVRKQLAIFNDDMVRVITAGLSNGDEIVLFINKADMLDLPFGEAAVVAENAYRKLMILLGSIKGAHVTTIVGSAMTGSGLVGSEMNGKHSLLSLLSDAAVAVAS